MINQKKNRIKKRLMVSVAVLMMVMNITGCGKEKSDSAKDTDSEEITMYLWDKTMSKQLTPWLEEQFPEIDFNFVVGYNSMDYYSELNDHGVLPDILTCRLFEEQGITCFATDYNADYSCLEVMQGCAIPELMSLEGTMWRTEYESETEDGQVGLDDQVWPVVFEKFEQNLKDTFVEPEDSKLLFADVSGPFLDDQVAIMRATANDCEVTNKLYGKNCVMLPYFGETEEDNWVLTYPMCQVAVNKNVGQDENKKKAVMKVMDAIFSEEGQRCLASGTAVLSYNKNVDIEMSDALSEVKDCVESNHLYIRLASTEIFSISKDVATKMITGEYGAKEAYEDFNAQLTTAKNAEDQEIIITQKKAYDYTFGDHGSPAVSSLLNTMRKGLGDDIAIGYSSLVSEPVYADDYTEQQLKWLMAFKAIARQAQYTGAEVRQVMEWLVDVKEDDKVYSVLLLGDDDVVTNEIYGNCPMPETLMKKRQDVNRESYNSYDCFIDTVKSCGQLEEPTEYVTILR